MGIRTIIFRGKRKSNGEWAYGNFVRGCVDDFAYIVEFGNKELCRNYVEVIPETVGQFTGSTDKNGKKIFEGDIIRKTNKGRHPEIFTANIHTDFRVNEEVYYGPCERFIESCEYEIIGNIHDNPELLKGGEG